MLGKMQRKGNSGALLVELLTAAATRESSIEVPPKIKNRTTIKSSNFTSGYLPPKIKAWKRYEPSYDHCIIIYNSQVMETTKVSFVDEWMKKMQYIHIQWNIYFSLQSEILPFVIT